MFVTNAWIRPEDGKGMSSEDGKDSVSAINNGNSCFFTDRNGLAANEDAVGSAVSHNSSDPSVEVYVVADGHCGSRAAEFAAANLPSTVCLNYKKHAFNTTENLLVSSLSKVRESFRHLAHLKNPLLKEVVGPLPLNTPWNDGACVLVAAVLPKAVVTAWAGDCLAIIVEADETGYVGRCLSRAHWPAVPTESKRLKALGYPISLDGRVRGMLNVSRTIGDTSFGDILWSTTVSTCRYELQSTTRYLVLMTDGVADAIPWSTDKLWPVPDNQTYIWARMQSEQRQADAIAKIVGPHPNAHLATQELLKIVKAANAIPFKKRDNISAIVVDLTCVVKACDNTKQVMEPVFNHPWPLPTPITNTCCLCHIL